MFVAELIRKMRVQAGLTQEQLSRSVDVKRSTISQYETGDRTPTLEMFSRIADAAGYRLCVKKIATGEKEEVEQDGR